MVERLYCALKLEAPRAFFRSSATLPTRRLGSDGAAASDGRSSSAVARTSILALALVHHLLIGRTIPMRELVDWFAGIGSELVIEFPDRHDVQVRRLLARKREDSHPDYTRANFEEALRSRFNVVTSVELPSGTRMLYYAAPV